MRRRLGALSLVLLVSLLIMAACGGGGGPSSGEPSGGGAGEPSGGEAGSEEPRRGGTIVIGWAEEPDTLDPHKTGASASSFVMGFVFGGLVTQDPVTGEYLPHIVRDWSVSEDGREVTFHLRDDVVFHSGKPFTAHDLKATWDRALNPDTQAVVTPGLLGPVQEIVVEDDHTLKLLLSEPFGPLFYGLTGAYSAPIDPQALEQYGDDFGRNPSGFGPYRFKEWVTGQWITLERNEDYAWGPSWAQNRGAPYPDELQIRYILEDSTRVAALETGEIHITPVPAADAQMFIDHPDFEVVSYPAQGVGLALWFNIEKEPLNDLRVRQALAHAVDRHAIIDAALDGHGSPAYGPLPPSIWGYWEGVEDIAYQADLDRAAQLLDEAGWTLADGQQYRSKDGKTLSLSLYITANEEWIRAAELLQAQLRQIGVEVNIENYEWGTFLQYLAEGRHDMNFLGYTYGDADVLYLLFHSSQAGAGLNFVFARDPELDPLLEGQRTTVEPAERARLLADAQRRIVEQAYWAPIYIQDLYVVVNKKVRGFGVDFRGYWLLNDIWLAED